MIGRFPLHPVLFAIFPIFSLYQANNGFTRTHELVAPLCISIGVASLVWIVLTAVTRSPRRAAWSTSILIVLFFGLGLGPRLASHVSSWLSGFWVARSIWISTAVVATALVPAAVAALVAVWRTKRDAKAIDAPLNLTAAVLVLLPGSQIASTEWKYSRSKVYHGEPLFRADLDRSRERPDIFYIVLDGYARADVLRDLFHFDNQPFLDQLRERGFFVANRSTSNYMQTPLSLASSLNAVYLDDLDQSDGDREPLRERIIDSSVAATLRDLGYRFVGFDSGFDITDLHGHADDFISPRTRISSFHQFLIESTPVDWFRAPLKLPDPYPDARKFVQTAFDGLVPLARDDQPTFAFVHILSPHPPFIFKADGSPFEPPGAEYHLVDGDTYHRDYGDDDSYVAGYTEQLRFLNRRVLETVDAILNAASGGPPPLIILQSDHGSGLNYNLYLMEGTDLRERFGNLTAVRWPVTASTPTDLVDTITPVNLFRITFNGLFDAGLPLLPDRCFYSTWGHPFDFVEVTDKVRGPNVPRLQLEAATPLDTTK